MGKRILDRVIYDAPGLKPGMGRPLLVIEIGEDGDLIEHAALDINAAGSVGQLNAWPMLIMLSLAEDELAAEMDL